MSWLNLNQSLNNLKGQLSNFATEVLSDSVVEDLEENVTDTETVIKELQDKCSNQELEIAALKKLNDSLQSTLQTERLARKNGVANQDDESSWYWDPPAQQSRNNDEIEARYQEQLRELQNEISYIKQQKIHRKHEAHTPVLCDLEEEVNRLREENRNLTSNLDDLDNQHQLAMERLLTLKKELQKNFEFLKQEHEDLKTTNDDYAIEIKQLKAKIDHKDKEIDKLTISQSEFETLHHKYQHLEKIHSLLRENAEKFQEENQDLHEEIFKLQEEVTKLQHEMEVSAKHFELTDMVPKDRYDELLKELNDLRESRRNSERLYLDEINIDDNAKSVIENLKRDINDLKHKLAYKEDTSEMSQHKSVQSEKLLQLYNKYVNFELPTDYVGEIPTSDDDLIVYKLEWALRTLNLFKKDIDILEHKLSEKTLNQNHLQTQIDDLSTENDYLTADLQQYESEMSEMKKNNDFLISEIAALKNTSKLEPIIETHEDNIAKLETELADSNRVNKTFESEIQRIEQELKSVKDEKHALHIDLDELKNNYTLMSLELDKCKAQTKAIQELEDNVDLEHKERLQKFLLENEDLKKKLHLAVAKNEENSIDIRIIENEKVLLTKQIEDLKIEIDSKLKLQQESTTLKLALERKLLELEGKIDDILKNKIEVENQYMALVHKIKNMTDYDTYRTDRNDSLDLDVNEHILQIQSKLHDYKESQIDLKNKIIELEKVKIEKYNESVKLEHMHKENDTLQAIIQDLCSERDSLRKHTEDLEIELANIKAVNVAENDNATLLRDTVEQLNTSISHHNAFKNEIANLQSENRELYETKVQLENDLAFTDSKIADIENKVDKLIAQIEHKEKEITKLNETISDLNETIQEMNRAIASKDSEIAKLNITLSEIESCNVTENEQFMKLSREKDLLDRKITELEEKINLKNKELSNVKEELELLTKSCLDLKSHLKLKNEEIIKLTKSLSELTQNITKKEDISENYSKMALEKEALEKELSDLQTKVFELGNACLEYKTMLDNVTSEKAELVNLVNLKHNESIQYHNEILRLNHVLVEQTNELKKTIHEKDNLPENQIELNKTCKNCDKLKVNMKEKDDIILQLNNKVNHSVADSSELAEATDIIKNLADKCENLDKNLTIQLETVKKLTTENTELSDREQGLTRELERLRHHLVEIEENYTQELMASEQKLNDCQVQLHVIEDRAKQNSTVYTSNSIRANQEVETLRNQLKLLEKQRDDVQLKLSAAEDANNRSEAALTNLQVVLEQFLEDKERDVQAATEKIRKKMEEMRKHNSDLKAEISRLNSKLEESLAGLKAASRLGDQLETKNVMIIEMKEQVSALQSALQSAEERHLKATTNQQDKVDKGLVKNLLINYIQTGNRSDANRVQVLRILSTVLDFNQSECEKLGLSRNQTAGVGAENFAREFVKFLEKESRPLATPISMMGLTLPSSQQSRSNTPSSRKSSGLGPNPNPFEVGQTRNTSAGSSNLLLQNIEATETSAQLFEMDTEKAEKQATSPSFLENSGVNQTRNTEGAILKYVLRDIQ